LRPSVRFIVSLSGATALVLSAQPAFADNNDRETADIIAEQINSIAPTLADTTRIPVKRRQQQITAAGDDIISIPADDTGTVELEHPGSDRNSHLSVGLPSEGNVHHGVVAHDGTVAYQNSLKDTDVAAQAFSNSVRIQTVAKDAAAPSAFSYPVDVPPGGALTFGQSGSILVLDAQGVPIGGFAPPWAKDGEGRNVPTRFEIRGNTVVQIVAHQGATYPVVADPWLWMDLIKSAKWQNNDQGYGRTLAVTPTTWARLQAGGYLPGVAGWHELYDKYKDKGLTNNLDSMENQYICHQQFVAIRSPRKPTWDLDEWRPDVGYPKTVAAQCNPGNP
jgi:hypothetical protein